MERLVPQTADLSLDPPPLVIYKMLTLCVNPVDVGQQTMIKQIVTYCNMSTQTVSAS